MGSLRRSQPGKAVRTRRADQIVERSLAMANPSTNINPQLYPAIRDALVKVLDSATPGLCEVCGKSPAQPYAFAYASLLTSRPSIAFYGPIVARAVYYQGGFEISRKWYQMKKKSLLMEFFARDTKLVGQADCSPSLA